MAKGRTTTGYGAAMASLGQICLTPIAESISGISVGLVIYLVLISLKTYSLGFIMSYSRQDVEPVMSQAWPMTFVLLYINGQASTNWAMAGSLAYPYYTRAWDRAQYYAGAMFFLFCLERASRHIPCSAQPSWMGNGSLLLYIFHPAFATCLIQMRFGSSVPVPLNFAAPWYMSTLISCSIALGLEKLLRRGKKTPPPSAAPEPSETGLSEVRGAKSVVEEARLIGHPVE